MPRLQEAAPQQCAGWDRAPQSIWTLICMWAWDLGILAPNMAPPITAARHHVLVKATVQKPRWSQPKARQIPREMHKTPTALPSPGCRKSMPWRCAFLGFPSEILLQAVTLAQHGPWQIQTGGHTAGFLTAVLHPDHLRYGLPGIL